MLDKERAKEALIKDTELLQKKIVELEKREAEYKQLEEALQCQKKYFQELIENTLDIIMVLIKDGTISYINPSIEQILAYRQEDVVGKSVFEFVHLDDAQNVKDRFAHVIQNRGYFVAMELRVRHRDGSWRDFEGIVRSSLDKSAVAGFVINARDITDSKRAYEALQKSEEKYRELVENANSIILRRDPEGRITFFNEFAQKFFGYTQEEILGKNEIGAIVPEIDNSGRNLAVMIKDIGQHPEQYANNQNENMRRNGQRVWISWTNKPIYDSAGKIVEILCVGNDITERKKAEEALRESEEKYRVLVENSPDFVAIFQEGTLKYVNKAMCERLGWTFEEMTSASFNPIEKIIPQRLQSQIRESIAKRLRGEDISPYEISIKARDGSEIPVIIKAQAILYCGKLADEIIHIDITERKKAEQKLQAAYEKLEKTQQELIHTAKMAAIGRLAAGISHELNQPLTGIKGFAQAALTDLDKKNLLRSDLKKIVQQTDRIDGIIKSVRLFARRSEFKMEKIDINRPLRDSIAFLKQQLKVQNTRVNASLGKDLPEILGDHNQLQQVFLNLITNARDAIGSLKSPEGGELQIKTFLSKDKKNIEIIFKDTGCGIFEEDLKHIFEPFFTTKSSNGDIGLGLSIVYGIIENHLGKIEVESQIGKGTAFKITLPIAQNKK